MHSIKTKLLSLILGLIAVVFLMFAGIGTYYMKRVIKQDTLFAMQHISQQKTREMSAHFESIERAVSTLEDYILKEIDTDRLLTDVQYKEDFMNDLTVRAANTAIVTGDVAAVYFRLEPGTYGGKEGIFLTWDENGSFNRVVPTDLTGYAPDDREHVGWFYEPVENGKPTWMEPYFNQNIGVYMISYVIPVYKDGKLLGIVGIDVDMKAIQNIINSINYENGFGFLIGTAGNLIYHKDYPNGLPLDLFDDELRAALPYFLRVNVDEAQPDYYIWHREKHWLVTSRLENQMVMAVSVPESDIMRLLTQMEWRMILTFFVVLALAVTVAWQVTVRIVRPIQELTDASAKIAKGDLNVEIRHHSKDEIGMLADSIRKTDEELREYISCIHAQAYADAMTGAGNRAAYMEKVKQLEKEIGQGQAGFGLIIFDVNSLKRMNDTLGHEYGDMLIKDVAGLIKEVYGTENVFRLGGDEFAVICIEQKTAQMDALFGQFDEKLDGFNKTNERYKWLVTVSHGAACYEPGRDEDYKSVFRRADEQMYRNKQAYYKREKKRES